MPNRGFEQLSLGQVPTFGIANQIQDELGHLTSREDRPPLVGTGTRELSSGLIFVGQSSGAASKVKVHAGPLM